MGFGEFASLMPQPNQPLSVLVEIRHARVASRDFQRILLHHVMSSRLINMAVARACLAVWISILWVTGIDCKQDHFPPKPTTLDPGAVLKVSPFLEIKNGAEVNVMWSGVTLPSNKDVVVLYCPPDANPDRYLDYINVSSIATYSKGYGEFDVRLWNMRKECIFKYYRTGNYRMLVAESNVVTFEGGAEKPLQVHLALTGNPTEMRVMWVFGLSKLSNFYKA